MLALVIYLFGISTNLFKSYEKGSKALSANLI